MAVVIPVSGSTGIKKFLQTITGRLGNAPEVRVGFLDDATYPDTGESVALVAYANEYGDSAHGRPPRPFMRNTIAAHKGEWGKAVALNLRATGYDAKKTLDRVGQGIAGQMKQSIIDLTDPPLAPSTIARKGFDKPLIDTSHMLNSVDYEVSE
jgi:hypothetical protein